MKLKRNFFISFSILCLFAWTVFPKIALGETLIFNTQDVKPFSYKENGKVAGPVKEIIDAICKEAGFQVKYNLYPWARAIDLVKSGDAHGAFVVAKTKAREEWMYFTPPMFNAEYGFFFNTKDPIKFKSINDLKGKGYKVGVYGPSNTSRKLDKIAKEITDMVVDQISDDTFCFKKLSINRVQAVYSNRDAGMAIIKENNIKNIRYGGRERPLKYYVGLSKQSVNQKTFEKFTAAYKKLYKSGKIKKIIDSHGLEISELE